MRTASQASRSHPESSLRACDSLVTTNLRHPTGVEMPRLSFSLTSSLSSSRRPLATSRRQAPSRLIVILALASFLPASVAGADTFWRWVDDSGVVNYTQQKPYGVDAVEVSTLPGARSSASSNPAPAATSSAPAPRAADGSDLSASQQSVLEGLQSAEQARQDEIARINQENCDKSRSLLDQLSVRSRIRVRGADGEQRAMPEDERQSRISDAQRGVAEYCSS